MNAVFSEFSQIKTDFPYLWHLKESLSGCKIIEFMLLILEFFKKFSVLLFCIRVAAKKSEIQF